ncbi:MAG: hypothetical protein VKL39_23865 [Leptolyngbyaceae bacterium]|nr:hypothetical protein [Leptolyngbyaceae bacterium]
MSRRLPDIVEVFTRRFREVGTLIKHPGAVFRRNALKRAQIAYENTELSLGQPDSHASDREGDTDDTRFGQTDQRSFPSSDDRVYAEQDNLNLDGRIGQFVIEPDESIPSWMPSLTPPLSPGTALKGSQWYRYHINKRVRDYPWVRWYEATNQSDETVLIQEYLLPDTEFHPDEIEKRTKAFVQLVNLNIHPLNGPGEGRDFRILRLVEAFVSADRQKDDGRTSAQCYLVSKPLSGVSLNDYIRQYGYLHSRDVREVVRQVLQTLQFLHEVCRVQFSPTHMERGIPHGNLTLDSLFIRQTELMGVSSDRQFFIHVTDLMLWEHLIHPPSSPKFHRAIAQTAQELGNTADDLRDLGRIGFQLAGCMVTPGTNSISGLQDGHAQSILNNEPLYDFLCRLIGATTPFNTASEALQALNTLPSQSGTHAYEQYPGSLEENKSKLFQQLAQWGLPVAGLALLIMGMTAWLFLQTPNGSGGDVLSSDREETSPPDPLYISETLPSTSSTLTVSYQAETKGAWQEILYREFSQLEAQTSASSIGDKEPYTPLPLMDEIDKRHPRLQWNRANPARLRSRADVIQFVRQSPRNVGLIRAVNNVPDTLETHPIAQDGLAVLVPFRDAYNTSGNIPAQLEGYISLDELRKLYTSDDLESVTLRGFPVQLYFPHESTSEKSPGFVNQDTLQIFREVVLNNDEESIRKFDNLRRQASVRDQVLIAEHNLKNSNRLSNNLYEKMLYTYELESAETNMLRIGFDRLSRAFEQCSTFPLAIGDNPEGSIQPLTHITGDSLKTDADLCADKSGYYVELSKTYLLRYDLALVYQKGSETGEVVQKTFLTQEAQYLMSEVGLIPLIPMQTLWSFVWGQDAQNK